MGDNKHPNPDRYVVTPAGCWEWAGRRRNDGYGELTVGKIHQLAHRYQYIKHRGPIPAGKELDHLCRNRPCCNPAHLEPVSRALNLQRGATARFRHGEVQELRKILRFIPRKAIARMYGTPLSTINDIARGHTWQGV